MGRKIFVMGTFIMDNIVSSPRMPKDGETVIGKSYEIFPGGKGINQAVGIARLDGQVNMIGTVGNDKYGRKFLEIMDQEKVGSEFVSISMSERTGIGFINVDSSGENRIVIVLGANKEISINNVDKALEKVSEGDIVVSQMELPLNIVEHIIEKAYSKKATIILNPAPAVNLKDEIFQKVTYLTPNMSELEILSGRSISSIEDIEECARGLYNRGLNNIIVTIGNKGACIFDSNGFKHVPAYKVKAIDSVGGGDAFNAGLAVMIRRNESLENAVNYANAVGALAVTKNGAIPSLPYKEEVEVFIKKNKEGQK